MRLRWLDAEHTIIRTGSHRYLLVEIAAGIVCVFWLAFASRGWAYGLAIAAVFFSLGFIRSQLLKMYERTGEAVRLPRAVTVASV